MASTGIGLAFIFALAFTGHNAILWLTSGPKDGSTVFVCEGSDVILDWTFTTELGDEMIDIQWYFQADGGQEEAIAGVIHGHFFHDLDRLEHVPLGGLKVKGVKAGDVGLYWVRVNYQNSSGFFFHVSSARLQIYDVPVVSGGYLTMQRTPGLVKDEDTGKWTAQLECGVFQNVGNPPVTVQWTTPSGDTRNSTSFNNGTYVLSLPSVVETGDYHCAVVNTSDVISCLNARDQHALLSPATLPVDSKDIRIEILMVEKGELENTVKNLTVGNGELAHKVDSLTYTVENLTSEVQQCHTELDTPRCRSGWAQFQSSCYKVEPDKVTYADAKSRCEAQGSILAEITSSEENTFVQSHLTTVVSAYDEYYFGINDMASEGAWVLTSSGIPLNFTDWVPSEPNDMNGIEDCGAFYVKLQWNDVPCTYNLSFICEYSLLCSYQS